MYLLEAVTAPPRCRFITIRKTLRGVQAHRPVGGEWTISRTHNPHSHNPADYIILERSTPAARA